MVYSQKIEDVICRSPCVSKQIQYGAVRLEEPRLFRPAPLRVLKTHRDVLFISSFVFYLFKCFYLFFCYFICLISFGIVLFSFLFLIFFLDLFGGVSFSI